MNTVLDLTPITLCILLGVGSSIGWGLWKKLKWEFRYWLIPMFLCYTLLLIKLTVFPIHIYDKETLAKITEGAGKYSVFYQLLPFASIKNYFLGSAIIQLVGNIALLSPLAVFAEIFSRQRPKAWKVALGVSSVSLLVEITQLIINLTTQYPSRVADIDDLILNIVGVIFAIDLTRIIRKNQNIKKYYKRSFTADGFKKQAKFQFEFVKI